MTLEEIALGLGAVGDLDAAAGIVPAKIQTDSRAIRPGEIFVCIPGDRYDGHNFASQAVNHGACAVVAQKPLPELEGKVPVLLVTDTIGALGKLAANWRGRTKARVIGVTGTAGKTTVKEMLASVLSQKGKTAKNYKNLNNQLGLALSILNTEGDEDFWVLEAGISRPGDMDELGVILQPDVAVIPNIGPAHLEGLGDVANVAREKAKILEYLKTDGLGLVNKDYPELLREAAKILPGVRVFSGKDRQSEFYGKYLGVNGSCMARFQLKLGGDEMDVSLSVCGEYMNENILAAAATAAVLELDSEEITRGLMTADIPEHRFKQQRAGDWLVIDDTYNANPLSMYRSISAAAELKPDAPLVLVLGEMGELGEGAGKAHEELGMFVAGTRCDQVFFQGTYAPDVEKGLEGAKWDGVFVRLEGVRDFLPAWEEHGLSGGTILFKGSRCAKMEEYVRVFLKEARS